MTTKKKPAAHVADAAEDKDTVEIVLTDSNRLHDEPLTIPKSELGFSVVVNGARYEHVDEDASGRWRYAKSQT